MGETVPGTVCAKHPLGGAPFPLSRAGWPLAVAILFGLAGCARAPRFEMAVCPPFAAGDLPAGPDYSIAALEDIEAGPAAAVRQAHDGGVLSVSKGAAASPRVAKDGPSTGRRV